MQNENYDNFFFLNTLANICQLADFQMTVEQTSNDDIMRDLQKQDEIMQDSIVSKLDIIIKQNKEIINLLKEK